MLGPNRRSLLASIFASLCVLVGSAGPLRAQGTQECPSGNLLSRRSPAWQVDARDPARATDERILGEGAAFTPDVSTQLWSQLATLVYDLGASRRVRAGFLQADHKGYVVAVSDDGAHWTDLWMLPESATGRGISRRSTTALDARARYVRLDAASGRGVHHVVELELYCVAPASLPSGVAGSRARPLAWLAFSPRAPLVGVALLALLAAAVPPRAWAAVDAHLGGRFSRADDPIWRAGALAVFALALAFVIFGFAASGYNVDEAVQAPLGIALVDGYAALSSGSTPRFGPGLDHLVFYGGFFEILAELAVRISPCDRTATRHLFTGVFGCLAFAATYGLGCRLHSRAAGFVAALALLLTPVYVGNLLVNPKDVPFAVVHAFAVLLICASLRHLPRIPLRLVLGIGIACGALLGIRVGAVFALGYLGLAGAWWLAGASVSTARGRSTPSFADVGALSAGCAGSVLIAWGVMLLGWPWAQAQPLARPLEALAYFRDITGRQQIDFSVFFEGRDFLLSRLPRHYTLRWLAISLPDFAALGLLGAVPFAAGVRRFSLGDPRAAAAGIVATSAALPLAIAWGSRVIQFDGLRHFLFVLPPLAALFGAGLVAFLRSCSSARLRAAVAIAGFALGGLTLVDGLCLHPYEYVYFNRSVAGGLERSAQSYETDVLGLSYREGVAWVVEHRAPLPSAGTISLASCPGYLPNLREALRDDRLRAARFRVVRADEVAQLVVAGTRHHCERDFRGRVLATVARFGVPLALVIETRPPDVPDRFGVSVRVGPEPVASGPAPKLPETSCPSRCTRRAFPSSCAC